MISIKSNMPIHYYLIIPCIEKEKQRYLIYESIFQDLFELDSEKV